MLVPTVECKLLATWQGPFEVIERVGEVNYRVRQPGKPKYTMLTSKRNGMIERHCSLSVPLGRQANWPGMQCSLGLTFPLINYSKHGSWWTAIRIVFSSLPGCTHLVEHEINTQPGKVVNQRPYRLPEARKKLIEEEVKKML